MRVSAKHGECRFPPSRRLANEIARQMTSGVRQDNSPIRLEGFGAIGVEGVCCTDIVFVQPFTVENELARPLPVVTRALTDALLGCLLLDLSHRRRAGRT